jgi:uncharacterized protein (TIGR02246 family)
MRLDLTEHRRKIRAFVLPLAVILATAGAGCAGNTRSRTPDQETMDKPAADTHLADRLAIRDLIERFHDAINHHEWSKLDPLFAEDAVWEALPPIDWRFEGRPAIKAGLTANLTKVDMYFQIISATAIDVLGPDRAAARSTLSEMLRFKETGVAMQVVGSYTDQLVKRDGKWLFLRRSFRLRFEDEVPAPDRVFDLNAPSGQSSLGTTARRALQDNGGGGAAP